MMIFQRALLALAQGNAARVRGISDSFTGSGSADGHAGTILLLLLLVLVVIVVAYSWLHGRGARKPTRSSRRLFEESLAAVGLTREDQHLLTRIVQDLQVEHPTTLLLSAAEFDETAHRWTQKQPPESRQRLAERLQDIRKQAFSRRSQLAV